MPTLWYLSDVYGDADQRYTTERGAGEGGVGVCLGGPACVFVCVCGGGGGGPAGLSLTLDEFYN